MNIGRLNNLTLARSTVNRTSDLRTDQAKLEELWDRAKILIVVNDQVSATDSDLIFYSQDSITQEGERYFLGIDQESDQSYFAWHTQSHEADQLRTLRQIGALLSNTDAGLAVHAVALSNWHGSHPRCPKCGAPTQVDLGGAARLCTIDASQHHPRTDPAVIVLVKDLDDRILLGHQPIWPEKRFSTFAGFVEPGESFEQCVIREVAEESGLIVHSLDYLGSQPWPFPASIMIAFQALTSDASLAKADGVEITEIRWFTREQMKAAVASEEVLLPPRISVARRMIEHWYGSEIETGESWRP